MKVANFSVSFVVALALAAAGVVVVAADSTTMNTCAKQDSCTTIIMHEQEPENCSNANCQYKICMGMEFVLDQCVKEGPITHTCLAGGESHPTICNPAKESFLGVNDASNEEWQRALYNSHVQCQIVGPGEKAVFALMDEEECTGSISTGDTTCAPAEQKYCHPVGRECIWTITAPECSFS